MKEGLAMTEDTTPAEPETTEPATEPETTEPAPEPAPDPAEPEPVPNADPETEGA